MDKNWRNSAENSWLVELQSVTYTYPTADGKHYRLFVSILGDPLYPSTFFYSAQKLRDLYLKTTSNNNEKYDDFFD